MLHDCGGADQDKACFLILSELAKPTTLALHDPDVQTKVSANASLYGLGVVLLQRVESEWKPAVYASHSMTDAERRYAQIEKEALAITWAREEFSDYILGKSISMETDHKPLVPVLVRKSLDSLPP